MRVFANSKLKKAIAQTYVRRYMSAIDPRDLPNCLASREELDRRDLVLKSATAEMTNAEINLKKKGSFAKQPFAGDWTDEDEARFQ